MSDKDSKFSFRFLGVVMEAMNLKPDSFVKIFWHLALIAAFIMILRFSLQAASHYFGI
ncbi:hypothetical protein [Acinetobacter bouvetii]|uniref:hypothetical protein n=1 Tax=Acinetobacter bouvetii TaxID=202951 RepID=UPI0013EE5931|nr:hypothetical protein [Acinetobacter bouvetii]